MKLSPGAIIVIKMIVTFIEAGIAYYVAAKTPHLSSTVIAGIVGAGISGVYNVSPLSPSAAPAQPASTPPAATNPTAGYPNASDTAS
jgi:hypothetical protein